MQELDSCRELPLLKPEEIRRVEKPNLGWLDSVEDDVYGHEELVTKVAGVRTVEDNFGRGKDSPRTVMSEEEDDDEGRVACTWGNGITYKCLLT
jgi:hypothetical protein